MKVQLRKGNMSIWTVLFALSYALLVSCSSSSDILQNTNSWEEAEFELELESKVADIQSFVFIALMSQDDLTGGRKSDFQIPTDDRFSCAQFSFNFSDEGDEIYAELTIDYGEADCIDKNGDKRRGKIFVKVYGSLLMLKSEVEFSTDKYYFNDISININATSIVDSYSLDANGLIIETKETISLGEVGWTDGTFSTRTGNFRRKIIVDVGKGEFVRQELSGSAQGQSRGLRQVKMEIMSPLVYESKCIGEYFFVPTKGLKELKIDDSVINFDYGEGICDNVVTISSQRGSKDVTVSGG